MLRRDGRRDPSSQRLQGLHPQSARLLSGDLPRGMPITASINRHPETESQSETAAPHPEEMKATFDLAIGNAVSVKAAVRTTPAGLVAAALLAAAVLFPAASLAKRLLDRRL